MRYLLTLMLSGLAAVAHGQEARYYAEPYTNEADTVAAADARYVAQTTDSAGMRVIEMRQTRNDRLVWRRVYREDRPYGVWQQYDRRGRLLASLDYAFEVPYAARKPDSVVYINLRTGRSVIPVVGDFVPPVMQGGYDGSFAEYLRRNLEYPGPAVRQRIEGTPQILVRINADGTSEVLSVYQGVETHLDKEAARLLREMPRWTPALRDGEPVRVYALVRVRFKLT